MNREEKIRKIAKRATEIAPLEALIQLYFETAYDELKDLSEVELDEKYSEFFKI